MSDRMTDLLDLATRDLNARPTFTEDVLRGGRTRLRRRRSALGGLVALVALAGVSLTVTGSPTRNILLPGMDGPKVTLSPNAPYTRVEEKTPWDRAYAASGSITVDARLHRAQQTRYDKQSSFCSALTNQWECVLSEKGRPIAANFTVHSPQDLGGSIDEGSFTFTNGTRLTTYTYVLRTPVPWLDLPIGSEASSALYNSSGSLKVKRTSETSWDFDLALDRKDEVKVTLTTDAPRPPWKKLRLQVSSGTGPISVDADLRLEALAPQQP